MPYSGGVNDQPAFIIYGLKAVVRAIEQRQEKEQAIKEARAKAKSRGR